MRNVSPSGGMFICISSNATAPEAVQTKVVGRVPVPLPRGPPKSVFVTARTREQFPHPLHCLIP